MNIFSGIKTLFGFDGVGDTALRIVDRIAGTDWTPEQRAEYHLKYMEVTKYQSPTRRVLAILYMSEQFMLCTVWLGASVAGRLFDVNGAMLLAADITAFLQSNVNVGLGVVVSFYFLLGAKK